MSSFLEVLLDTFNADAQVRAAAETRLRQQGEQLPEQRSRLTGECLDLCLDLLVAIQGRAAAAIYFKNRVVNGWPEVGTHRAAPMLAQEQQQVLDRLVPLVLANWDQSLVRQQLTTAMATVLARSSWPQAVDMAVELLTQHSSSRPHVMTALYTLQQVARRHRYVLVDLVAPWTSMVERVFPLLEQLARLLVGQEDAQLALMLYLVFKIWKYATFVQLPPYLLQDTQRIGEWVLVMVQVIQTPVPAEVLAKDPAVRVQDPRVKCVKWACAGLSRLQNRFSCRVLDEVDPSKRVAHSSEEIAVAQYIRTGIVPQCVGVFLPVVQLWLQSQHYLSDASIYHLITFFEGLVVLPTEFHTHVMPQLEGFLRIVVFQLLSGTAQLVELFDDDPEEYTHRQFDMNRETSTPDVAAGNFLYQLLCYQFSSTIGPILQLLTDVFEQRHANPGSAEHARACEGALRVLATSLFALGKEGLPVRGQVDEVIMRFVVPELAAPEPFVVARACECVLIFSHLFQREEVLSAVYQRVRAAFVPELPLPVQIEAADALRALVHEEPVRAHMAGEAPAIMARLLQLLREFELDMLLYVMEAFVEVFAEQLTPFAVELATSLTDQFCKLATDLLELQLNTDEDKEYQALGVLNTLISMALSMNSSSGTTHSLEKVIAPAVRMVLDNAMVLFLPETMEFLESCNLLLKQILPTGWELYAMVMELFQTFGQDCFPDYSNYLELVVMYGFVLVDPQLPTVMGLVDVCLNTLTSNFREPTDCVCVLGVLQQMLVVMGERASSVMPILLRTVFLVTAAMQQEQMMGPAGSSAEEDGVMPALCVVKLVLAAAYADAGVTFQVMLDQHMLQMFFESWEESKPDLDTVLGLKLQIAAICRMVVMPQVPPALALAFSAVCQQLRELLQRLPDAVSRRQQIAANDRYGENGEAPDTLGPDWREFDALKTSPLYDLQAAEMIDQTVGWLKEHNQERYVQVLQIIGRAEQ